jgi:hypothetical protein
MQTLDECGKYISNQNNPIFTIRKKANEESKFVIDMTFTVNRDTGSG